MKQITTAYGIIFKNNEYYLFKNGTVVIFDNECEVFAFETEQERDTFMLENNIVIEDNELQ
jgi:hypothetical protein